MARLYFYHCRLCEEECRAQDALDAIVLARWHIEQAARMHPEVLDSTFYVRILSNHGIAHLALENYVESETFHKEAIGLCGRLGLQEQCSMGNLMQNLAACYLWSGKLAQAENTLNEAMLQPNKNREGAVYTRGNLLLRLARYDEALLLHKEVLQVYIDELGPWHPTTADSWHKLGSIFIIPAFASRDLKEAE